jgi:hypothetical protein
MPTKPALSVEPEYRSRLEKKVGAQLAATGVRIEYEELEMKFLVPSRIAKYTTDFPCGDFTALATCAGGSKCVCAGPILLEVKGYFYDGARDRQRLVQLKETHPKLDLRIVFQDANKPIYKASKTTYGKWATDHGIPWATGGVVPAKWIEEILKAQRKEH